MFLKCLNMLVQCLHVDKYIYIWKQYLISVQVKILNTISIICQFNNFYVRTVNVHQPFHFLDLSTSLKG